jgi:glycine/D-amino acid oxidase-like deaminating enzyme
VNKTLRIDSTLECDLLIIGAGGAGFRCAAQVLEKRPETRVIALTKGAHPQKSHTSTAQGGLAAVDPRDPADKTIFHKAPIAPLIKTLLKKFVGSLGQRSLGWKTAGCISAGTRMGD